MPLVSIFGAALTNLVERSFKDSIHTNLGQMEMFIPHITRGPHVSLILIPNKQISIDKVSID